MRYYTSEEQCLPLKDSFLLLKLYKLTPAKLKELTWQTDIDFLAYCSLSKITSYPTPLNKIINLKTGIDVLVCSLNTFIRVTRLKSSQQMHNAKVTII